MTESTFPIAAEAEQVPPRARKSLYPQAILDVHGARLEGREKRALGDLFGLQNFGVNLTKLEPARRDFRLASCPCQTGRVHLYLARLSNPIHQRRPHAVVARHVRRF